jgi:SOS-response transcriptional repressor LexA
MTTTAPALQPLTAKQKKVYRWIAAFYRRERIPPSVREIQAAFDLGSPNGAVCHIKPLVKKGWLEARPNTARSILPTLEALAHEA